MPPPKRSKSVSAVGAKALVAALLAHQISADPLHGHHHVSAEGAKQYGHLSKQKLSSLQKQESEGVLHFGSALQNYNTEGDRPRSLSLSEVETNASSVPSLGTTAVGSPTTSRPASPENSPPPSHGSLQNEQVAPKDPQAFLSESAGLTTTKGFGAALAAALARSYSADEELSVDLYDPVSSTASPASRSKEGSPGIAKNEPPLKVDDPSDIPAETSLVVPVNRAFKPELSLAPPEHHVKKPLVTRSRLRSSAKSYGIKNLSQTRKNPLASTRSRNSSKVVGNVSKYDEPKSNKSLSLVHRKGRHSSENKTSKFHQFKIFFPAPEIKSEVKDMADLPEEITSLPTKFEALQREFGTLDRALRESKAKEAQLEGLITTLQGSVEQHTETLAALVERFTGEQSLVPEEFSEVGEAEVVASEPEETDERGFFGRIGQSFKGIVKSAKTTLKKNKKAFEVYVLNKRRKTVPYNEMVAIRTLISLIKFRISHEPTSESDIPTQIKDFYDQLNEQRVQDGAKPFQTIKQFEALARSLQQLQALSAGIKFFTRKSNVSPDREMDDILTRMRLLIQDVEKADYYENYGTEKLEPFNSNKVRNTRRSWFSGGKKKTRSKRRSV
jgi:hypothetical protein